MVFILGASGSGKSTLLNVLGLLDDGYDGKIYYGEKSVSDEAQKTNIRRKHIAFIFQEYNLINSLTVKENVQTAVDISEGVLDEEVYSNIISMFKLNNLENRDVATLSGGEKQRVAIARALVRNNEIIFADEPTGNLDSRTSKQVLYRMLEMSKNSGVTFVMVTHEPELAGCADRIVTILDGKVCSNVLQDEETKKKNRDALFADLEGDLDIGGEAAKEQPAKKPSPKGEGARRADEGQCSRSNPAKEE